MEAKMDATIRAILEAYFGKGSVEDVIDDLHREIYKAGIREVVEWGDSKCPHCMGWNVKSRKKCEICWQAKLKEWGL